jgi:hypothetical protein
MKNSILFVLLSVVCLYGNAQDRKNVIKFLPVNLAFGSINFEFERMINEKNSFELGIGIPMDQPVNGRYGLDLEDDGELSNDKQGDLIIRAAYRHYTGKSMLPKGFYLAPYLKYQGITGSALRTVPADEDIDEYTEDYDVKINSFSLGLQLGYQFLIAKRISLDLYFLGLEGGFANLDGTILSSDIEQVSEIEDNLNENIDELPSFIGDKIEVASSGNTVKVKGSSVPYPWLRGGISIGIAF